MVTAPREATGGIGAFWAAAELHAHATQPASAATVKNRLGSALWAMFNAPVSRSPIHLQQFPALLYRGHRRTPDLALCGEGVIHEPQFRTEIHGLPSHRVVARPVGSPLRSRIAGASESNPRIHHTVREVQATRVAAGEDDGLR